MQVFQLCHATHDEQAREIDQGDGLYHFKSRPKPGKYGDKSYYYIKEWTQTPDMGTPSYRLISQREEVFPGCYSWWGLAVDPSYDPPLDATRSLPPYLKRPRQSVYGGNAFQSTFSNLLQCYDRSRGCEVNNIYLKMGGTLRYKREIGYVVIICTSKDLHVGALKTYKPISDAPRGVFDPSGLVDEKGKMKDVTCVPLFTTHFTETSHETLNFAFYFPSETTKFKCRNIERCRIKHNGKDGFCIKRVKINGKLCCPDNPDM